MPKRPRRAPCTVKQRNGNTVTGIRWAKGKRCQTKGKHVRALLDRLPVGACTTKRGTGYRTSAGGPCYVAGKWKTAQAMIRSVTAIVPLVGNKALPAIPGKPKPAKKLPIPAAKPRSATVVAAPDDDTNLRNRLADIRKTNPTFGTSSNPVQRAADADVLLRAMDQPRSATVVQSEEDRMLQANLAGLASMGNKPQPKPRLKAEPTYPNQGGRPAMKTIINGKRAAPGMMWADAGFGGEHVEVPMEEDQVRSVIDPYVVPAFTASDMYPRGGPFPKSKFAFPPSEALQRKEQREREAKNNDSSLVLLNLRSTLKMDTMGRERRVPK
jgi:hypothetical protein